VRFNRHHKRALLLLLGVILADVAAGLVIAWAESVPAWHGVYCTVALTTTDGCDLTFHSGATYAVATVAMILFVPLWASVFSLFTAGLTADHVNDATERQTKEIKDHLSS
jgi:hypothetical protein